MIDDYLTRNRERLRWFDHYERYGRMWTAAFPARTLREIVPGDIDRYIAKRRQQGLAPASINLELAFPTSRVQRCDRRRKGRRQPRAR